MGHPFRVSINVLDRPSTTAAETRVLDQIVAILEKKRGERKYADLAREIGVSRPMLRLMDLNGTPPGLDTLSMLVDWDPDTFVPVVIEYLHHRGCLLRSKTNPMP